MSKIERNAMFATMVIVLFGLVAIFLRILGANYPVKNAVLYGGVIIGIGIFVLAWGTILAMHINRLDGGGSSGEIEKIKHVLELHTDRLASHETIASGSAFDRRRINKVLVVLAKTNPEVQKLLEEELDHA